MAVVYKDLYEASLEAGASQDQATSAAIEVPAPYLGEIKQIFVELKNDTTFLKLAVLVSISFKVQGCLTYIF